MTESATFADPLRAYIITLRKGRDLSQAALARRAGMRDRTYVAWERGETRSLKSEHLKSLIKVLGGAIEHLDRLDRMSAEEAHSFALEWLSLSEEQRMQAQENAQKLRRVIELNDRDPAELEAVIEQIRQDAQADPAFLTWLSGYLAGRRGARPPRG